MGLCHPILAGQLWAPRQTLGASKQARGFGAETRVQGEASGRPRAGPPRSSAVHTAAHPGAHMRVRVCVYRMHVCGVWGEHFVCACAGPMASCLTSDPQSVVTSGPCLLQFLSLLL